VQFVTRFLACRHILNRLNEPGVCVNSIFHLFFYDWIAIMISNAKKPAAAASKTLTPRSTAPAAKPAVKPRTTRATASAARKRPVAAPKAKAPAAARTVTPAAVGKKPTPVKKAVAKAAPVADKKAAVKPVKVKKPKLVRDSFTMPEGEYELIAALKKRCLNAGVPVKKSEILRAAVANLAKLSDTSLLGSIRRLPVIKTARPAKGSE
jgi:pyruvate/2-oxoglutarate dehydrogenase complex dihydrolipoamide acyltransferase (E2) component